MNAKFIGSVIDSSRTARCHGPGAGSLHQGLRTLGSVPTRIEPENVVVSNRNESLYQSREETFAGVHRGERIHGQRSGIRAIAARRARAARTVPSPGVATASETKGHSRTAD